MNKYLNINAESVGMCKYRKDFTNQHSKFLHSSWLLKEDLDKQVTLNGTDYTIWGLYDIHHSRYYILLKPVGTGAFYIEDSKTVARALGYTRMRNLVTGVEHPYDYFRRKGLISVDTKETAELPAKVDRNADVDEDMPGDWVPAKEGEYVDPLVKALQDDLIDDGDTSAY